MALLLLLITGSAVLQTGAVSPVPSPGCARPLPSDVKKGRLQAGWKVRVEDPLYPYGIRDYVLFVPFSYKDGKPSPMVLDLHGYYDRAWSEAVEDGVTLTAEGESFIVAYPSGLPDNPSDPGDFWNQWNAGGTNGSVDGQFGRDICLKGHGKYPCYETCARAGICKPHSNRKDCGSSGCADDVGFVAAMLKKLKDDFCIDESRVHGTGMSLGAMFLYRLAVSPQVGYQLASVVPVEGSFTLGFIDTPKVPMPFVDIHGTKDNIIPANVSNSFGMYKKKGCPLLAAGLEGCTVSSDLFLYHPVGDILKSWAAVNQCDVQAQPTFLKTSRDGQTGWTCVRPFGDSCKATVQFCTHNLGHTWPFGEGVHHVRTRAFGDAMWEFMKDKRRSAEDLRRNASIISEILV